MSLWGTWESTYPHAWYVGKQKSRWTRLITTQLHRDARGTHRSRQGGLFAFSFAPLIVQATTISSVLAAIHRGTVLKKCFEDKQKPRLDLNLGRDASRGALKVIRN